jgi:hypothetical protein
MIVYRYKVNFLCEIKSIDEFDKFVKTEFWSYFIKTPPHLYEKVSKLISRPSIDKTVFCKAIKKLFSCNGKLLSKRQIEFWTYRGYTEDEARQQVSLVQKKSSMRTIEYWTSRGYTEEDAKIKRSEHQKKLGNRNKLKPQTELRRLSHRCVEYWTDKGYTIEDAKKTISKNCASYSNGYWETATEEQKRRNSLSGKRNGMYGKPPPNGSGNGYSGWYNGIFFRSLLELNYMVNVLDRFRIDYQSAENKKYRIPYTSYDKSVKTYSPDFIVAGKYLVEVKPKPLWRSTAVKLKKLAAENYCDENGLKYKLVDPGKMNADQIKSLYESGKIVFMKRYKTKFLEYLYT